MLLNSMQDNQVGQLSPVDEIETLRQSVTNLSNEIREIVASAKGSSSAWHHTDLLMSSCRMKFCMNPFN